jgi:hypothetical protein
MRMRMRMVRMRMGRMRKVMRMRIHSPHMDWHQVVR